MNSKHLLPPIVIEHTCRDTLSGFGRIAAL